MCWYLVLVEHFCVPFDTPIILPSPPQVYSSCIRSNSSSQLQMVYSSQVTLHRWHTHCSPVYLLPLADHPAHHPRKNESDGLLCLPMEGLRIPWSVQPIHPLAGTPPSSSDTVCISLPKPNHSLGWDAHRAPHYAQATSRLESMLMAWISSPRAN